MMNISTLLPRHIFLGLIALANGLTTFLWAEEPSHPFKDKTGRIITGRPVRVEHSQLIIIDEQSKISQTPVDSLCDADQLYVKQFLAGQGVRLEVRTSKRRAESKVTKKAASSESSSTSATGSKFYDKDLASRKREQEWMFDLEITNRTQVPIGPFTLEYVQFAEQIHLWKDSGGSGKRAEVRKQNDVLQITSLAPFEKFKFTTKSEKLIFEKTREKRSASDGFDFTQNELRGDLDSVRLQLKDSRNVVIWEYYGPGPVAKKEGKAGKPD
jgi:hypothetical protein